MKQIRYTVKIRLLCFILGPASLLMGLFFVISGSNLFNVLANIFGIIGLAIMLLLNFGKFEKEDESATKNYGNACSVLLEILLALGCLSALISLFTNKFNFNRIRENYEEVHRTMRRSLRSNGFHKL